MNTVINIWFALTGVSLIFVILDIPKTPESVVLKWAFVILTAFTGPVGALLYVFGCRAPLKTPHQEFVSATWRQVLGSTMHCAAGDGIGIVVGAVIGAFMQLGVWGDFLLEYALGFGFGWAFFQAFAMRDMVGGSYLKSLRETFIPELLSMNVLMAGMVVVMKTLMPLIDGGDDPLQLAFWFVMSMAMLVGFVLAYPVNWWLVVNNLKHGMLTVGDPHATHSEHETHAATDHDAPRPDMPSIIAMGLATFVLLWAALWLVGGFFG